MAINYSNWDICKLVLVGLLVILTKQITYGYTNDKDVAAMNILYADLGKPVLPGWIPNGGDPCLEAWQGVTCVDSNITSIILNAATINGKLGESLGSFTALETLDFSNNQIGGSLPASLPVTMKSLFLSANQLSGNIPSSLSSLMQLSAMSLNDNHLSGEIPDAFMAFPGLVNLDLSGNNLTGELPPTIESLSSLTTLHLQDNQLSGTLDVLQDLPLSDLNVENNLFSGSIPEKLLSIPNFKTSGNLFNTTSAPESSPADAPAPPLPGPTFIPPITPAPPFFKGGSPPSEGPPTKQASGTSTQDGSSSASTKKTFSKKQIVGIAVAGGLIILIIIFGLVLIYLRCCRRSQDAYINTTWPERGPSNVPVEKSKDTVISGRPNRQTETVPEKQITNRKEEHAVANRRTEDIPVARNKQEMETKRIEAIPQRNKQEMEMKRVEAIPQKKHVLDIERSWSGLDAFMIPPPPPPPPPPPAAQVVANPISSSEVTTAISPPRNLIPPTSVRPFTVASLQQYTNSFSQENLIGGGRLGSVYRAELPDGKLLAVKKLDNVRLDDEKFLELVSSISKLQHVNVVELVGYCLEHGQRLLIYEYCSNGTLNDSLHSYDEASRTLSWNVRIRMALGAARALEYLHETRQPPVVHRNFKAANVLLDDELTVRVSDCGLAPLLMSGAVSQLSGHLSTTYGYGAPEFETGTYTHQSDVYSFGVVMLELLTGRKSYDRSRPRGEHFLVRWAMPQLHDIEALSKMVDPSLNGNYPAKSLSRFADIISLCVQSEPEFRPPMSEIVQNLVQMIQRGSP